MGISFFISMQKAVGILIGIMLNLQIALDSIDILAIFSLPKLIPKLRPFPVCDVCGGSPHQQVIL